MTAYDPRLSHFDIDFERGAQGELLVTDIRRMLADGSGTIEVKTDFRFVEFQRFYIERECRGRDGTWRPSGIAVTKATFWAFVLGKHPGIFIFDTDWVKRATEFAAQDERNHASCDYGENPTRGVLVYLNHLMKTREDYDGQDDFAKGLDEAYQAIRERVAKGGPGWTPK